MNKLRGSHNGIPWRSHDISRIEALSDAVFAFAVTLLVVALEVPQTFGELWEKMHGFLAFAISFALLFHVWFTQHTFFRRYGLQDTLTVVLNGVLLFLVLFYMYPLKFLFTLVTNQLIGGRETVRLADGSLVPMLANVAEGDTMMVIYSLGFGAIFGVFVLLYAHALKKGNELGLTAAEFYDCRASMWSNALMVGIAAFSMLFQWVSGNPGLAGVVYALTGVGQTIFWSFAGGKRRRLFGT